MCDFLAERRGQCVMTQSKLFIPIHAHTHTSKFTQIHCNNISRRYYFCLVLHKYSRQEQSHNSIESRSPHRNKLLFMTEHRPVEKYLCKLSMHRSLCVLSYRIITITIMKALSNNQISAHFAHLRRCIICVCLCASSCVCSNYEQHNSIL